MVPRVSVIIGFRDWGVERLRLAVRSHRQSTLASDLEVIVVDYGSRDAACVRRAVEEEGGRPVRVEAGGRPWSRARALNHGIRQAARGHLILTTDSDILFGTRTTETILTEIDQASGRDGTYALVQVSRSVFIVSRGGFAGFRMGRHGSELDTSAQVRHGRLCLFSALLRRDRPRV